MLYGPPYVSLEWVLSFYGMIPERVQTITGMTTGKNKEYRTSVGTFSYQHLAPNRYSVGITQKKADDFFGHFLMASPEKALADWVFITSRHLDKKQLQQDLLESKRIDRDTLQHLNKSLLSQIAASCRSKSVGYSIDIIGTL